MGWIFFASTMMILSGIFHVFTGIGGIAEDDVYVRTANYTLQFDVTTWGWIHLIVGLVILFASFGLYKGAVWARTVGVIMAVISAFAGLRVDALLPDLGDHDRSHSGVRDLGSDGSRPRRRPQRVEAPILQGVGHPARRLDASQPTRLSTCAPTITSAPG